MTHLVISMQKCRFQSLKKYKSDTLSQLLKVISSWHNCCMKYFFIVSVCFSSFTFANPLIYLSCISESNHEFLDSKKLWIRIDRNEKTFTEITEESIKKLESYSAGKIFDLKETTEFYNSLDRTTLIYRRGIIPHQCIITSREVVIDETKRFLSRFLANRKL